MIKDATAAAGKGESVTTLLLEKQGDRRSTTSSGIIAERLGVPPIDLDRLEFAADVPEWMPEDLARKRRLRPDREDRRDPHRRGREPLRRRPPRRPPPHHRLRPPPRPRARAADHDGARASSTSRGESDLQDLLEESEDGDLTVKEQLEDEVTDLAASGADSNDAAGRQAGQPVHLPGHQGEGVRHPRRAVREAHHRPLPRRRRDARGDVAARSSSRTRSRAASRSWRASTSPRSGSPQDGKFQVKVEGRQIDFRVSVLPTVHGEKVVLPHPRLVQPRPLARHARVRAARARSTSRPRSTRPTG